MKNFPLQPWEMIAIQSYSHQNLGDSYHPGLFLGFQVAHWLKKKKICLQCTCSVCAGDIGSIPGSGRSSGEGNGYPLQYSCLDRGAWWTVVHGDQKELDTTKQLTTFKFNLQGSFQWESRERLEMIEQCKILHAVPTFVTGHEAEGDSHSFIHCACSTFSHFCPRLSWTGLLTWWHIPAFNPVWSELLVVLSLWHHDKFLLNKTAGQKSTKDVPASILWFSKEFFVPSWCSNNLNSLVIKISHLFFAACETLIFCSLSSSAPTFVLS